MPNLPIKSALPILINFACMAPGQTTVGSVVSKGMRVNPGPDGGLVIALPKGREADGRRCS